MPSPSVDESLKLPARSSRRRPFRTIALLSILVLVVILLTVLLPVLLLRQHHTHATGPVGTRVALTYATYDGTALDNGVTQWLGIRYAAPPTGQLRFAAPQDPLKESTPQTADQHGKICLGSGDHANSTHAGEDCLFLDVYAPTNASSSSPLPVYFFIQGGGFNGNSNSNCNGSGLVLASEKNMVVVNFNYRVGPYGFLASKEVLAAGSVNNGLKDQRKALEWVQNNILYFGGDPKKVTIGGVSAGAASVTLQLTAYGGKDSGLFHAAAAESQSFGTLLTVEQSQYQYDNFTIRTGCAKSNDTLACLRSLDANAIQTSDSNIPYPGGKHAPLYMYGPVIDGDFIQDFTYSAFQKGNFVKVPAIYGDDTNEGTLFSPRRTANSAESSAFLQAQFPYLTSDQLTKISSLYPLSTQFPDTGAYWRQVSNAYGEMRYICPGIALSGFYSQYGVSGVFNYHWDVIDTQLESEGLGVPHIFEISAIWGPGNTNGGTNPSYLSYNRDIVAIVQGYWTSFIRTAGDPNKYRAAGTPNWDQFTADGQQRLRFKTNETGMETVPSDQNDRCQYLSSIATDIQQ